MLELIDILGIWDKIEYNTDIKSFVRHVFSFKEKYFDLPHILEQF